MKKEYFVLIIAIAGLAFLMFYQKQGRTNYQLPKLAQFSENVDRLVLQEVDRSVELRQVDGRWVVGPKLYRADSDRVAKMVDEIRDLQLVALISGKENYQLYELNEIKRFTVQLYHDKTLLREVIIGKNSASLRHTYVMLKDDTNVYQALGNLRSNFFSKIEELMDKEVMKISRQERKQLDKILLEQIVDGKKELFEMFRVANAPKTDAAEGEPVAASGWQLKDGTPVIETAVSGLLDTLVSLKCSKYLDDLSEDEFEHPDYRVVVSGAENEFSIAFLEPLGDEYRALSSQTAQPFQLPAWQARKLVKEFSVYTGAKKKTIANEK